MKLTPLEIEQVSHINTRRTLAQLSSQIVERDAAAVESAIRARLGIEGTFQIAPDWSVLLPPAPPEAPLEAPVADLAADG